MITHFKNFDIEQSIILYLFNLLFCITQLQFPGKLINEKLFQLRYVENCITWELVDTRGLIIHLFSR